MLDITTLAAWGELLGGIGVIISLIYLASQIRQNSKLVRTSTASATAQLQLTPSGMMAQDPEVARIYWDGLSDRDSLSEADRRQFDPLVQLIMFSHLQMWEFSGGGVGSSAAWDRRADPAAPTGPVALRPRVSPGEPLSRQSNPYTPGQVAATPKRVGQDSNAPLEGIGDASRVLASQRPALFFGAPHSEVPIPRCQPLIGGATSQVD